MKLFYGFGPGVGLGSQVLGPGFPVLGLGFEVLGPGFEVLGQGFEVFGPGFEVFGPGFEVLDPGFEVLALGYEDLDPEAPQSLGPATRTSGGIRGRLFFFVDASIFFVGASFHFVETQCTDPFRSKGINPLRLPLGRLLKENPAPKR